MYLVTGAAGFIGQYVVKRLLAEGKPVRLFDLRFPTWLEPERLETGRLEFFRGDVTFAHEVRRAMAGVHTVLHLAAQMLLSGDDARMRFVNVEGTRTVLEAAMRARVDKVVYTSTGMLYGPGGQNAAPTLETDSPMPSGPYGKSKAEAEAVCQGFIAQGLELAILRPLMVVGPGRLGVLHLLFQRVQRGRPLYMVGNGQNRFHMIDVADLAEACVLATRSGARGAYNVGVDTPHTVRRQLEALRDHAGTHSAIRAIPVPMVRLGIAGLARLKLAPLAVEQQAVAWQDRVLDCSKARAELGWRPRSTDLEVFLATYDWYRQVESGVSDQPADWPDGGIFKWKIVDKLL